MEKIDGIDKRIIRLLMRDASLSLATLSENLGLSESAVFRRKKRLEDRKIIARSVAVLNTDAFEYKTLAFVGILLKDSKDHTQALEVLNGLPEVLECFYTTGHWSLFVKILCKDNDNLMSILSKKIQTIPGVSRTETFISLKQHINRQLAI